VTRPRAAVVALAALVAVGGIARVTLSAHAGVILTDPLEGATLGDSPTVIRLSFSESAEAALSDIRVLGTSGVAYQLGTPQYDTEDRRTVFVRVRPLERGVYTVHWRIVSALDGHATAGAYVFGVRTPPTVASAASGSTAVVSRLEMLGRWLLIAGLAGVLGAASARIWRFGGARDLDIGCAACALAMLGLALLAFAQRSAAGAPLAAVLRTSIGRAIVARAAAIVVAAMGFLLARRYGPDATPSLHRAGVQLAAAAGFAGLAVHVAHGHAASSIVQILSQGVHFAAAAVWLGGLAVLLAGVGVTPSASKAHAVRRFSALAGVALFAVIVTGVVRSVNGLTAWSELWSTGYGMLVLVKAALIALIACLGYRNRSRNVPLADRDLLPLRRTAGVELVFAVGALAAAAALTTLAPPASALAEIVGLSASGADFATTVRARLTAVSDQPGPNRFVLHLRDYDSNAPIRDARVGLRFTPLDDPQTEPTTLALAPGRGDTYTGSGANLSFEGRWRLTALVQRGARAAEVPLDLETGLPVRNLSIERLPNREPVYTVQIRGIALVQFAPESERPGPTRIAVTCFDMLNNYLSIDHITVIQATDDRPSEQRPVERVGEGRFVADVVLRPGRNRIVAAARTSFGTHIRAGITISVR